MTDRTRETKQGERRIRKQALMMIMMLFLILFSGVAVYAEEKTDNEEEKITWAEQEDSSPLVYIDTGTEEAISPGISEETELASETEEVSENLNPEKESSSADTEEESALSEEKDSSADTGEESVLAEEKDSSANTEEESALKEAEDTDSSEVAEDNSNASTDTISTADPSVNTPLAPKDGSATIIEFWREEKSVNDVDELLDKKASTYKNDVPNVNHIIVTDKNSGQKTDDYWAIAETGQCVDIDEALYPLPKKTSTSSSAPINAVQITTTTYYSSNAIQKAVDSAVLGLSEIKDSSKNYTVVIEVDPGEYDGDITIQRMVGTNNIWDKVTIYILGKGSFTELTDTQKKEKLLYDLNTIGATADGSVHINGSIKIENLNVVLAGLSYKTDQVVFVENGSAAIYGTEQQDTITVEVRRESNVAGSEAYMNLQIYSGAGSDIITVKEHPIQGVFSFVGESNGDEKGLGNLEIHTKESNNASGDTDLVNLEIDIADCFNTASVNGTGRIHFTGKLNKEKTSTAAFNKETNKGTFTFYTNGHTLTITTEGFTQFTDELTEKEKITVSPAMIKDDTITINHTGDKSLVEYYIDTADSQFLVGGDTLKDVSFTGGGLLVSLKIEHKKIAKGETKTLNIGNIIAKDANVSISAQRIVFLSGRKVSVNNLIVEASVSDDYISMITEKTSYILYGADTFIKTEEGSVLETKGDLVFSVSVNQAQNLFQMETLSFVNVKLGDAVIKHAGTISTGGGVQMKTLNTVKVQSGNNLLADRWIPVAINVAIVKSYIDVADTGVINANGTIDLSAASDVNAGANAVLGKAPVVISIAAIINKTHVDVKGSLRSLASSIILKADSVNTIVAGASAACADKFVLFTDSQGNYTGQTVGVQRTGNGVYLALSGINVTTYVTVTGKATVSAGHDVILQSNSKVINSTFARTTDAGTAGTVKPLSQVATSAIDTASTMWSAFFKWVKGKNQSYSDKAALIEPLFVATTGYSITLEGSGYGTVSSVYRGKAGQAVDLIITPDELYTVDSVTMRYTLDGKNYRSDTISATKDEASGGVYYWFYMPDAPVIITVNFRESIEGDPVVINRSRVQADISVEEAAKAADQEYFQHEKYEDKIAITTDKVSEHGTVACNTGKAGSGQKILFTVEAEKNYVLKSLTVKYKVGKNVCEETVAKTSSGYVFTIPDNFEGTSITYSAIFAEKTAESKTNTTEKKGCIAAAAVRHSNTALIDTEGSVTCGGNLSVSAIEDTQSSVWADASAVKQVEETQERPLVDPTGRSESEPSQTAKTTVATIKENDRIYTLNLTMSATKGGTYGFYDDQAKYQELKFAVTPMDGYDLSNIQLVFVDKKDGSLKAFDLVKKEDPNNKGSFYYTIDHSKFKAFFGYGFTLNNYTDIARLTVLFTGKSHEVQLQNNPEDKSGLVVTKAGTGSLVTIPLTQEGLGYTYYYRDQNKKTIYLQQTESAVSFLMPNSDVLLLKAKKSIRITSDPNDHLLVQGYASAGETVQIKMPANKAGELLYGENNYKYEVTFADGTVENISVTESASFTVPQKSSNDNGITIKVIGAGQKAHEVVVKGFTAEMGSVTGNKRVNGDDTLVIVATAKDGYVLDNDSPVYITYYTNVTSTDFASIRVDLLENTNREGVYTYKLPGGNSLLAGSKVIVTLTFKKSEIKMNNEEKAFGGALSATVFVSSNTAEISKGTITANGISVVAESGTGGIQIKSEVLSNAGYSTGTNGFAGALSVNLALIETTAKICKAAKINLGTGSLIVEANCRSQIITKAMAADPKSAVAKKGTGAGVNFSVTNVITNAEIQDGTSITQKTNSSGTKTLNSTELTVQANTIHSEVIAAKAGSAGGTSRTPAVSVVLSGVKTNALVGSNPDSTAGTTLNVDKDVTISATSAVSRTVNTDANSNAVNSAMGMGITATILNDSAESRLKRSVKAKGITVHANAKTYTLSTAQASSKGGRAKQTNAGSGKEESKEDSDADPDPDSAINNKVSLAMRLAAFFGKKGNASNEVLSGQIKNRQKAQTTEGNVTAAGAANLNIQNTKAIAEIADGLVLNATGKLSVVSAARSDAYVTATSKAVGSEKGIGVSIAFNVITITNEALIGASTITADSLEVGAITPSTAIERGYITINLPEKNNVLTEYIKQVLNAGLDYAVTKMGISDSVKTKILKEIEGTLIQTVNDITETMLNGTGLKGLISADVESKIRTLAEKFSSGLDAEETNKLKGHLLNLLINTGLIQLSKYFITEDGKALQPTLIKDDYQFSEVMIREVSSLANELFDNIIDPAQFLNFIRKNFSKTLKNNWNTFCNKFKVNLSTHATNILLNLLDVHSEVEVSGNRSVISTQAISGAGSSDVGLCGAFAAAKVDNIVRAEIAGMTSESEKKQSITVTNNIIVKADDKVRIYTVGTSAANQDGTADDNSGAGANSDTENKYDQKTIGKDEKITAEETTNGQIVNAEILPDKNVKIYLTPDQGYCIKDVRFDYNYKNEKGETVSSVQIIDLKKRRAFDEKTGIWSFTQQLGVLPLSVQISATFEEQKSKVKLSVGGNGSAELMDLSGSKLGKEADYRTGQSILVTLNPESGFTFGSAEVTYGKDGKGNATFNKIGGNTLVVYVPYNDKSNSANNENVTINIKYIPISATNPAMKDDGTITPSGARVGFGASFALTRETSKVTASIGDNRKITAGAIEIAAISNHIEDTKAIAGVDPLSVKGAGTKINQKTSIDAAVAITSIDSSVISKTGEHTQITTTAGNNIILNQKKEKGKDGKEKTVVLDSVNFYMLASEAGTAKGIASSFSLGSNDAVGASVVFLVDDSTVEAVFNGSLETTGSHSDVRIMSKSSKKDIARATATSNGADLSRYFQKVGSTADAIQKIFNNLLTGDYTLFNKELAKDTSNNKNTTANWVNKLLNKNKDTAQDGAVNYLPASSNILRVVGASTDVPNASEINNIVQEANQEAGTANVVQMENKKKYQVAAVVAVDILKHNVNTRINGTITCGKEDKEKQENSTYGSILAGSELNTNFTALGTAAGMSRKDASNSIAAAIAFVWNKNSAGTTVDGTLSVISDATSGKQESAKNQGITILSSRLENCDPGFAMNLTAQSVSGALTGEKASESVAVAISIVKNDGSSKTQIGPDKTISVIGEAGIMIRANDKSKLSARAGAVSVSKQTALGTGASFALIYDNSTTETVLGKNTTFTAGSLQVTAIKEEVNSKDAKPGYGITSFFITKSTAGQPTSGLGLVDFVQDPVKKTYTATVNISTDKIIDLVNRANMLINHNYYVEAIAGDIVTGSGKTGTAAGAGSVAMVFYKATTGVRIEENVTINSTGEVKVQASDYTKARVIAGAVNVAPAKFGVGVTVGVFDDQGNVAVTVGDGSKITAASYKQNAKSSTDVVAVTIAASVDSNVEGILSVGGTVNTVLLKNTVISSAGKKVVIQTTGDIQINAEADNYAYLISGSCSGSKGKVAVGGSVGAISAKTKVRAEVNSAKDQVSELSSTKGNIVIRAYAQEKLVNALGSISRNVEDSKFILAATLGVIEGKSTLEAIVGDYAVFSAGKDISVTAAADSWMLSLDLAVSHSSEGVEVGGSVIVNVLNKTVLTSIGKYAELTAIGNVVISSYVKDWELLVALTVSTTRGTGNFSGVFPVCISNNTAVARVNESAIVKGDSIGVLALIDSDFYTAAGGITVAIPVITSKATIGTTVATLVNNNTANADVKENVQMTSTVSTGASGISLPNRKEKRRKGITVYAGGNIEVVSAAISSAIGGRTNGIAAVVSTVVMNNRCTAKVASGATLSEMPAGVIPPDKEESESESDEDEDLEQAGINIEAVQKLNLVVSSSEIILADGLACHGVISTLVLNSNVDATLEGSVLTTNSLMINAYSDAKIVDVTAVLEGNFAAKNVAAGGAVQTLVAKNTTIALLKAIVQNSGDVKVIASDIVTIQAVVFQADVSFGSGGNGAVAVTYFRGNTRSAIEKNVISVGKVIVYAYSKQYINGDATGGAASANIAVSGGADIVISELSTEAWIADALTINASDGLTVLAENDFRMIGVAVYTNFSGKVTVGVAAVALVDNNSIKATIGNYCTITSDVGDVTVKALTKRDVTAVTAAVCGSGKVAVGVSVIVVVSGNKMMQDAHNMIYHDGWITPEAAMNKCLSSSKHLQNSEYFELADSVKKYLEGDGTLVNSENGYLPNVSKHQAAVETGTNAGFTEDKLKNLDGTDSKKDELTELPEDDAFDVQDITVDAAPFESSTNNGTAKACVEATIGSSTNVTAKNIYVIALEEMKLTEVAGQVAGSGKITVGPGLSITVMNTVILASVEETTVLTAAGDIVIQAGTGVPQTNDSDTPEISNPYVKLKETLDAVQSNGVSTDGCGKVAIGQENKIILIGFAGAGSGTGAVTVNGSAFVLHDNVRAVLASSKITATNVAVKTAVDYKEVLSVSAGVAGAGTFGVGISLSMIYYNAQVVTALAGKTELAIVGNLVLESTGDVRAQSAAANLAAAGTAAVGVNVALMINKIKVTTFIGQGVYGRATNVEVSNSYKKASRTFGISAAFSMAAIGVPVAVATDQMDVIALIGNDANYLKGIYSFTGKDETLVVSGLAKVENAIIGELKILGVPVAVGKFACTVFVAVGTNKCTGIAKVADKKLTLGGKTGADLQPEDGTLVIRSVMNGNVKILTIGACGALGGAGVTVAVGKQTSKNQAVLVLGDNSIYVGGNLTIEAKSYSDVTVQTAAIAAALYGAGMNFVVALNNSENDACVIGGSEKNTFVVGKDAVILADGKAYAYSYALTANVHGVGGGALLVYSKIQSTQRACIETKAKVLVHGNLTLKSYHNDTVDNNEWKIVRYVEKDKKIVEETIAVGKKANMSEAVANACTAGGASIIANIAITKADAKSKAYISATELTCDMAILVENRSGSTAMSDIIAITFNGAKAGTTVAHSYAKGTFKAYITVERKLVGKAGIQVLNTYSSDSIASMDPSAGLELSIGQLMVNFAYAKSDTVSKAYIKSASNAIVETGNSGAGIKVQVTGETAGAYATVSPAAIKVTGMSLVADVSKARVVGTQDATVEGGHITADSLSVKSIVNYTENDSGKEPANDNRIGAHASVGFPLISVAVTLDLHPVYANAKFNMTGNTLVDVAGLTLKGDAEILTKIYSKAVSDSEDPVVSGSLASIPISILSADAAGVFDTKLNVRASSANADTIQARNISVITEGNTFSKAELGIGGGCGSGLDITGLAISVNEARSHTNAVFTTTLSGAGSLYAKGDVTIKTIGNTSAEGGIKRVFKEGTGAKIGAIKVKAMEVKVYNNVSRKTALLFKGSGTVVGNLYVFSEGTASSSARGGFAGGFSFDIFGTGIGILTETHSASDTSVYIYGGTLSVHNLVVHAVNNSSALAEITDGNKVKIGGFNVEVYLSSVTTADKTDITIKNVGINASGEIEILANGKVIADTTSIAANSMALLGVSTATLKSEVKGTVEVHIGPNAALKAVGNIRIEAVSEAENASHLGKYGRAKGNKKFTILQFTVNDVPTVTKLKTTISIENTVSLVSSKGSISILAHDDVKASSRMEGDNSIGLLISATYKKAVNHVESTLEIAIRNGVLIQAEKAITINAYSKVNLHALTFAESNGFSANGDVTATNYLVRKISILINKSDFNGDSVRIISKTGDIAITTDAGSEDEIDTQTKIKGAGFIVHGVAVSQIGYESSSCIFIGKGVTILAENGKVSILATVSLGKIYMSAYSKGSAGFKGVEAQSNFVFRVNNNPNPVLCAKVEIEGSEEKQVIISGDEVEIKAFIGSTYVVEIYATGDFSGIGYDRAYVRFTLSFDIDVSVCHAYIVGNKKITILSSAEFPSDNPNSIVKLHSKSYHNFWAKGTSHCNIEKLAQSPTEVTTKIGQGVVLKSNYILIDSKTFKVQFKEHWAQGSTNTKRVRNFDFGSIGKKDVHTFYDYSSTYIADGTHFIMGENRDAVVTVEEESKKIKVTCGEGLTIESNINDKQKTVTIEKPKTLTRPILEIHNNKNDNGLSKCIVDVNNSYNLFSITNKTDYHLILGSFVQSSVSDQVDFKLVNCKSTVLPSSINPEIAIYKMVINSQQKTNVTFSKNLAMEDGELVLCWTGKGGNVTTMKGGINLTEKKQQIAGVWVHKLTIENAESVGTADNYFWVYMTQRKAFDQETGKVITEDPVVNITASGSVYLKTAPAVIQSYNRGQVPEPGNASVDFEILMQNIQAGNDCSIVIDNGVRINYAGSAQGTNLFPVGSVQLTGMEYLNKDSRETITSSWLEYYREDSLETATEIAYVLPNGMTIYVTKDGKVEDEMENNQTITRIVNRDGSIISFNSMQLTGDNKELIYLEEYDLYINYKENYYYLGSKADYIYQELIFYNERGVFKPTVLNGSIVEKNTLLVYYRDAEGELVEVDFEKKKDQEIKGEYRYTYKGKWLSKDESGNGYVAIFSMQTGRFRGIFSAKTEGEFIVLNTPVDVSYVEEKSESEYTTCYFYTDNTKNPTWYAVPTTNYFYVDITNTGVYHPIETESLYATTETIRIAGFTYKIPIYFLMSPFKQQDKVYFKVSKSDTANRNYISFNKKSIGSSIVINSQIYFTYDGTLGVNTNCDYKGTPYTEGYSLNYDVKDGFIRLTNTWKEGNKNKSCTIDNVKVKLFDKDKGFVIRLIGAQKLRLLSDKVAVSAGQTYWVLTENDKKETVYVPVEASSVTIFSSDKGTAELAVKIIKEPGTGKVLLAVGNKQFAENKTAKPDVITVGDYIAEIIDGNLVAVLEQNKKLSFYEYRPVTVNGKSGYVLTPASINSNSIVVNFVGGGYASVSRVSADKVDIKVPSSERITIGDENGEGAICGSSLKLSSPENKSYKVWASVEATYQETKNSSVPFTFRRSPSLKESIPEAVVTFKKMTGATIVGKVIYKPSTSGKLTIDATDMYLGRDSKHSGFEVSTNVEQKNLTYICLYRNSSEEDSDETDRGAGSVVDFDDYTADHNSSDNKTDEIREITASDISMIAYAFLAAAKGEEITLDNLLESTKLLKEKSQGDANWSMESEISILSQETDQQLQAFMERYELDELTMGTITSAMEDMTKEERSEYAELLLKKTCEELLLGHTDQAEEYLKMAYKLDPENALVALFLGDMELQRGNSEKAEKYFAVYLDAETELEKDEKYMLLITLCDINNAQKLEETYRTSMEQENMIVDEELIEALHQTIDQWEKEITKQYEDQSKAA